MKPKIGITLGEPSGIGPEVTAKSLLIDEIFQLCVPVVFGSREIFQDAMQDAGLAREVCVVHKSDLEKIDIHRKYVIYFVETKSKTSPQTALHAIQLCADLCLEKKLDAMVTGPIDKFKIQKICDQPFIGHTEYLADRLGSKRVAMMLAGETLRVVPVTTHCALKDVSNLLTVQKIFDAVELAFLGLKQFYGISEPKIAVSALNPHAGEGGLFGSEEEKVILPAVEKSRINGMDVKGPIPADTLFYQTVFLKRFDAVVTMYHDQALIPLKMLHFRNAVNITLGLPIVRTSVDHGTAYDLVGKQKADESSMVEAIRTAVHLCRH